MTLDYPWYLVLLCLLLGIVYAAVLYFTGRSSFGRRTQWILSALRFLAVSAIAFLLLAPMTRRKVHEKQQPHIVVALDKSLSVKSSKDSSFSFPLSSLNKFRVTTIDFGNDATTDIGSVLEELVGGDADAVVLATDGIYNRGANPSSVSEHLTVPVYTLALGDTTPQRDAVVGGLRTNRVAMLGTSLPVEFNINASLLNSRNAQLSIVDAHGKSLHRQNISYTGQTFSQDIHTALPVTEAGLQRFSIRLAPTEGEVNVENNVLNFYVEVIDTRRKVAIVANAPHPDIAALRHAIESNPNYESEVILAGSGQAPLSTDHPYSLVIFHNLPSSTNQLTNDHWSQTINSLFIIGMQTDLSRLNALHAGLEINSRTQKSNEVTAIFNPAFSLFSMAEGDAEAIEQLPPLAAPFGEAKMAEGMQTLFSARLGNIDTRQPLIAATLQGETRRAFIWGEGLWRWRLSDYATNGTHDRFDRLIQQLVAFTAMQNDRARLRIEAERTYPAGQPINLRAQLYNESYQLTNIPEVKLDCGNASYNFHRDGDSYSLTLPDLGEGIYHYHAVGDGQTADGTFAVEALGLERRRLVADHALLRTISQTTGGQMYYPSQISDLIAQLSTLKPVIYSRTRYTNIVGIPLALIIILLLLAAEWGIRKYNGEI